MGVEPPIDMLARAATGDMSGVRVITGRWDGSLFYPDSAPATGLAVTNSAGPLQGDSRVTALQDGPAIYIIGPVQVPARATAGSNGNGSWWRSEDGLQVCWFSSSSVRVGASQYGGILYQGRWQWTFPMPFIGSPVAVCGTWQWSTGASWGACNGAPSATAVWLRGWDAYARTVADPLTICATAIGRWRN